MDALEKAEAAVLAATKAHDRIVIEVLAGRAHHYDEAEAAERLEAAINARREAAIAAREVA